MPELVRTVSTSNLATAAAVAALQTDVTSMLARLPAGMLGTAAVQYGSIACTGTNNPATISSVDITRSVVMWLGGEVAATNSVSYVTLTNATTVTAAAVSGANTIYFVVITFVAGAVKSIQDVSVTLSSLTVATATITAVTAAKALIIPRGISHDTNDTYSSMGMACVITNATTVTGHRSNGDAVTAIARITVLESN